MSAMESGYIADTLVRGNAYRQGVGPCGKLFPLFGPLCSPLFDPGRRPWVEESGRPSSRQHSLAAARRVGQGRPRAGTGATRSRRLAASMARTHPLTDPSTVAPRTHVSAMQHSAAFCCVIKLWPRARARTRKRILLGFKCSEAFFCVFSMGYPVDTRVIGGLSRVMGGIFRLYPEQWGASRALDMGSARQSQF